MMWFIPLISQGNLTPDNEIVDFAVKEDRIVVTKDSDFVVSYSLHRLPPKLLLVSTGNISNDQLSILFLSAIKAMEDAFTLHSFVELGQRMITIHA